jgi:hypothetical protein
MPDSTTQFRTRSAFKTLLNQTADINKINTKLQSNRSLIGFSVMGEKNLDDLLDPWHLSQLLDKAYKRFFAYAMALELRAPDKDGGNRVVVKRKF